MTENDLADAIPYNDDLQADAREMAAKMWCKTITSDDVRRWIGNNARKRNAWRDATTWLAQRMAEQRKVKRAVRAENTR